MHSSEDNSETLDQDLRSLGIAAPSVWILAEGQDASAGSLLLLGTAPAWAGPGWQSGLYWSGHRVKKIISLGVREKVQK